MTTSYLKLGCPGEKAVLQSRIQQIKKKLKNYLIQLGLKTFMLFIFLFVDIYADASRNRDSGIGSYMSSAQIQILLYVFARIYGKINLRKLCHSGKSYWNEQKFLFKSMKIIKGSLARFELTTKENCPVEGISAVKNGTLD